MAELHLKLFGGLELLLDGKPLKLRYPSAQALLVYLAVSGGSHHRDALAELLWGDLPASEAKANLRRVLSSLRQNLGDVLELTGDKVAFNLAAAYTLDVEQFRTRLGGGEGISYLPIEQLEEALSFYRGDFLAGFTLPAAPDFDEWSLAQLESLKDLALKALRALVAQHLARRRDAAAITALRRIIALDPWSEAAAQQLLVLLALSGQRDAVLTEFRRYEARLADLGEAPSRRMHELLERLEDGQGIAELLQLPKHNLENVPTTLLGRELLLSQIVTSLTRPDCRLLTLTGPGGVGKTRLSIEVGWQVLSGFRDGVFFVPLAPVNDPELVPGLVAQTLGLVAKGTTRIPDQLRTSLHERQLLLILDNFEQVTDAAVFVAQLLGDCPEVKMLVTSRTHLNLRGEQEVEVPPLPTPEYRQGLGEAEINPLIVTHPAPEGDHERVETLLGYPSVELFCERARGVRADFVLDAENAAAVAQICDRLDGLPLAIELAAARGKLLSPAAILARLDHRLNLLSQGAADRPERHQTLRATLSWSFDLLSESEQRVFKRLGVAVGSCSLALAGALDIDSTEMPEETLASLLDKSLLRQAVSDDLEPRVMLLETIREYALEKLAENHQDVQLSRVRHAHYFIELLEHLYLPLVHADREARRTAERDLENIRTAWLWAVEHRDALAIKRMALSFGRVFETRPLEAADLFAEAAGRLDETNPEHHAALGYLWVMQAWLLNSLGQPERALHLVEQGLALLEASREVPGLCKALSVKAWNLWFYKRQTLQAKDLWSASLRLARQHGVESAMGEPLAQLVVVELGLGTFEEIKELADRTLTELDLLGDGMQYTKVLCWSGTNLSRNGFREEGLARNLEAVELARSQGLESFLPIALGDAAEAAYRYGDDVQAESCARECIEVARKKGIRYAEARGLNSLGRVMTRQGKHVEAGRYLDACLVKAWEADDYFGLTASLLSRAELSVSGGNLNQAVTWLTFVSRHERSENHIRREAQTQLAALETWMEPGAFVEAAGRSDQVYLEALAKEALKSLFERT